MTEHTKRLLKDSPTARWVVLGLISLTMFFAYFFVDLASPIKNQFEVNYNWSSAVFGFYGGAEFFFNVFFAFLILSGIILDKLGIRFTLITSGATMVAGACIKLYALTAIDTSAMMSFFGSEIPLTAAYASLGFAVFGIGVEMAGITVSKTIVKWFKGKELALAMGLEMAIARLGVFAVMILAPIFSNNSSTNPQEWTTGTAFLWGLIFLTIGFLTFLIYTFMDKAEEKQEKELLGKIEGEDNTSSEGEFKFKDLKLIFFNPGFLIIAGLCVLFYSAIFPFQRFATEMISSRLLISPKDAAFYVSIFPIGAMVLTPFIGFFLDKKGLGAKMMFFGAILLTVSHLIFALTPAGAFSPVLAVGTIIVLGIAFSLVPASMWPSLPKIVEERCLGTAFGAIFWIQNIGLLCVPMIIGSALNSANPGVEGDIRNINTNIRDISAHIKQLDSLTMNITADLDGFSREFSKENFATDDKDEAFVAHYLNEYTNNIKTQFDELGFKVFVVDARKPVIENINGEIANIKALIADPVLKNNKTLQEHYKVFPLDKITQNMENDIAKFNSYHEDVVYNYTIPELIFAGFGVLAILLSLMLRFIDRKKGYGLDLPNIQS